MKRLTLLLATMGMALLLVAGVAFAATYECFPGRACVGTDGPDTLIGSSGADDMNGRQDADRLFGNDGPDFMLGDAYDAPENDTNTDGADLLRGGRGADELVGFGGADKLYGGRGGDFIFAEETSANTGEDTVRGSRGNDFIQARDGVKDTIDCGPGKQDVAFFDRGGIDTVANNCEYKNRWPEFEEFSGTAAYAAPEQVNHLRAR